MPKKSRKVIFQATTDTRNSAGRLPQVDPTNPTQYTAYFENETQDQFLFIYNYEDYPSLKAVLWSSKNGWEEAIPIVQGKPIKVARGASEKTWLKACWTVITAYMLRRAAYQNALRAKTALPNPLEWTLPSHTKLLESADALYNALVQKGTPPNCSRSEFIYGWTNFVELIAKMDAQRKASLAGDSADPGRIAE